MPAPIGSLLQNKSITPAAGAKPAWMNTQVATELLKQLNTVGSQVWLGPPSQVNGGFLLGWTSFEAAAAEFSSMARLILPGDEGKAAVYFVPPTGSNDCLSVGVARPAHLPGFAQRLLEYRFLAVPCPAQGRFPLLSPSLAQLLYQSVQAAVMYTSSLPSLGYTFTLGGALRR